MRQTYSTGRPCSADALTKIALASLFPLLCLTALAAPALAANIQLGSATQIGGVTRSGLGTEVSPWIYDYQGGDLNWGEDTAYHAGISWTTFTGIANVIGTGSGGAVNKGNTNGTGDLGSGIVDPGDLRFELTGSFSMGGFLSTRNRFTSTSMEQEAGDVFITAPGGIAINGWQLLGETVNAGLHPGEWSISANARIKSGDVSLISNGAVTLARGVNMSVGRGGGPGAVSGNLLIQGTAGPGTRAGAVSIGGDILRRREGLGTTDEDSAGSISIFSSQNVSIAGNVFTQSRQRSVQTNGSQIAGALTIDALGDVSIDGTTGITLTINSLAASVGNNIGGSTIVTSGGKIDIVGGFDLRSTFTGATRDNDGILSLTAGDTISVGSLDLDRVRHASFDADESSIVGDLLNFATTNTSGDGSVENPFVVDHNFLRAAENQVIYYSYASGGLNDYLAGKTYRLADLSGNIGAGGYLSFEAVPVPEPSTWAILAIGGAAIPLLRRRKRR